MCHQWLLPMHVGALQVRNSKAATHDLLEKSQRHDGYHPQLRHTFRLTPYPSNGEIQGATFDYAQVSNLIAFRKKYCPEFKGARTATLPS